MQLFIINIFLTLSYSELKFSLSLLQCIIGLSDPALEKNVLSKKGIVFLLSVIQILLTNFTAGNIYCLKVAFSHICVFIFCILFLFIFSNMCRQQAFMSIVWDWLLPFHFFATEVLITKRRAQRHCLAFGTVFRMDQKSTVCGADELSCGLTVSDSKAASTHKP